MAPWYARIPGLLLALLFALAGAGWMAWRLWAAGGATAYIGLLLVLIGGMIAFASIAAWQPPR